MLRQELLYGADQQHVLNPSPSLFTALKFSHLLTSSTTCGTNFQEESSQQLGQSPLHSSEGSTSAATPPECSSSPVNFAQQQQQQQQQTSSIWSDFLNGVPFMADETTLTPSSTGGGSNGPSTWWSSSSSSPPSSTTVAGLTSAPPSSREQDLHQQWSNFSSQASQASNSMAEMEASDWQLGSLATAPEVNEQLSKMAIESANVYSSIGTALVDADMTNNPSAWSSILMGGNGGDDPTSGLENTSVEGLQEALFSSKFNNSHNNSGKNVMLKAKDEHSSPSWEFLKSPAANFELEELGMNPKLVHQFFGQDARMELDPAGWPTMMNEPSTSSQQRVSYAASTDAFGRQQQFDPSKIKQEFEAFNSGSSSSSSSSSPMITMQPHCDVVGSRSMVDLQHMLNSTGEAASSRWGNKLPAMLSQVLPSSTPSTTKQASLFGSSVGGAGTMIPNRPFSSTNYTTVKQEQHYKVHQREQSSMSQHSSVTSQHSFDSKDLLMEDTNREVSSDQKRGMAATTDHSKASEPFFKRPRIEQQQNPSLPFKVRKEKLGERITALQQLVSPFGKTDTASVLLEAISYIKFLHEQVQVLSTPYMKNAAATGGGAGAGPTIPSRPSERGSSSSSSSSSTSAATATELGEEQGRQDLRSRGLCLVPISCTMQVANNDNGADFWAPTLGGPSGGAGNNSSGK